MPQAERGSPQTEPPEPARMQLSKPEQENTQIPAYNGKSPRPALNSPTPSEQLDSLIGETVELFPHLKSESDRHILNFLEQFTEPDAQPAAAYLRAVNT